MCYNPDFLSSWLYDTIARQVSLEEERRMIEQKEREQQMSERLIRQMQLEEDTHPGEESVAEDEVSWDV